MSDLSFKCRKYDLQKELEAIASAVDTKSKDEIYSCIYMAKTDSNTLLLAAASRDLMVTTTIKVDGAGGLLPVEPSTGNVAMAVEASKLAALVKKMPDKIIDVSYNRKTLRTNIRCDGSNYTLMCQEATFFPAITVKRQEDFANRIPLRFFHTAITHVLDMISMKESPLIYYSGALLILADKVFEVIATDGARMSVSYTTLENDNKFTAILPKKILVELGKNLAESQIPSIGIEMSGNYCYFSFGKYTYRTTVLAGSFPNYKALVDAVRSNNDTQFRMNRNQLQTAVERCLVFVGKDHGYGINITFGEKEAVIEAANERGDSAFEQIEAECSVKYKLRINGDFLRQYLNTVPNDETVDMWVNAKESMRPVYLRVQSDRNYISIMQPMTLTEGQ